MRATALSELQLDALREIGSVGAGHAATALSRLVDRPIRLQVPAIEVIRLSEIPTAFTDPEQVVCAVYARLLGDIGGGILFLAPKRTVLPLVDLLRGQAEGTTRDLGDDEETMLGHASGILIAAYLAAVARMADIDVSASTPTMVFDMAGAILETAVLEVDTRAEQAVLVRTAFVDDRSAVESALFFLPDPESLAIILGRLGVT